MQSYAILAVDTRWVLHLGAFDIGLRGVMATFEELSGEGWGAGSIGA